MKNVYKVIGIAVVCALLVSGIFSGIIYNNKINAAQDQLTASISKDMETYMNEYRSAQATKVASLDKRVSSLENIPDGETAESSLTTLTDSQIQAVIKSVTEQVKPQILKEVNSKFTTLKQETLTELESNLETVVKETLSETIIEEQTLSEIANSVQVIVETNILKTVQQELNATESNLKTLTANIEARLNKIEGTMSEYEVRIRKLENMTQDINSTVIKNGSEQSTNTESLKENLDTLKAQYMAFTKTAITTSHIVSDLTVAPADENQVLSAKTGYQLLQTINDLSVNLSDDLEKRVKKLEDQMYEVKQELLNNIDALAERTATKESLESTRDALDKAIKAEGSDREKAIQDAQTALNDSITKAQEQVTKLSQDGTAEAKAKAQEVLDQLIADKNNLESAIESAKTDAANGTENVNKALTKATEDINNQISDVEAEILGISNNITVANSNIKNNANAIDAANANIQKNATDISNAQTEIDNLKKEKHAEVVGGNLIIYLD